jgi:phosphoketolase
MKPLTIKPGISFVVIREAVIKNFAEHWQQGYGIIRHSPETLRRTQALLAYLTGEGIKGDHGSPKTLLAAADRLTNAAMWLAVHQAYAKNLYLDGRPLKQTDFKPDPQGHLGGSLNMIPAYVGYLLANALTGFTRGWVMEQGHAVAAIDSVNLLVGNISKAHAGRYELTDAGLTRFARDFYSYALDRAGKPDSPLGSHVNAHTAGGIMEGGYLGFAGLEYVHMPLPGERLVAFLSDGAWEEQKGTDWAPRWWRPKDSGLVVPIMIANGRRIDQRTTMAQAGGAQWFAKYLKMHGFDPIIIDGHDPLAFAWAIIDAEQKLRVQEETGATHIHLPYVIAVAPKGAGFYGEGSNAAHNLPLGGNPSKSKKAADIFNKHAHKLFVPEKELRASIACFQKHKASRRPQEKDNPIANRRIKLETIPRAHMLEVAKDRRQPAKSRKYSPMDAIDRMFRDACMLNPHLRPRVGNPDEMLSNRMDDTLRYADFRASEPEAHSRESVIGNVITVLNEEAVAAAAFGNKGGINLIVTYEAFGEKMHGIARQEVIFSRHQKEAGKPPGWLSVPMVLTSNTWENGKNELSHQDTSMAECMLGESSDTSRVFFPADYNTAAFLMREVYLTHGQVWTVVAAKQPAPVLFTRKECVELWENGGIRLMWAGYKQETASIALIAIGTHQLLEVLKASRRLTERAVPHAVCYLQEPGKFRAPRNEGEHRQVVPDKVIRQLLPRHIEEIVLVTHTRPEMIHGALTRLWQNRRVHALGFINEGGTLDVEGMLYVNRCSWAHIVLHAMRLLAIKPEIALSQEERLALAGKKSPDGIIRSVA